MSNGMNSYSRCCLIHITGTNKPEGGLGLRLWRCLNLGLEIIKYQFLDTDVNRTSDLTGKCKRISVRRSLQEPTLSTAFAFTSILNISIVMFWLLNYRSRVLTMQQHIYALRMAKWAMCIVCQPTIHNRVLTLFFVF